MFSTAVVTEAVASAFHAANCSSFSIQLLLFLGMEISWVRERALCQ